MLPRNAAVPDRLPDRDERAQINGHPQRYKAREPDPSRGAMAFIPPSRAPQNPPPRGSPSPDFSSLQPQLLPSTPAGHPRGGGGGGLPAIPCRIYSVVIAYIFFLSPVKPW